MKNLKKQDYIYVGVDLHKYSHTAVIVDCWNEKLDTITIENKPSDFKKLSNKVLKYCNNLKPIFGLENAYGYGRTLALWLIERGFIVKDINPALSFAQRQSFATTQKNDEHDAFCVATALINGLNTLPNANPDDKYWTLSQFVNRRDNLVTDGVRLKNNLHDQLKHVYPSYRKFFSVIDRQTALYFWLNYPSPVYLKKTNAEDLTKELKENCNKAFSISKAELIFEKIESDGDTLREYQSTRDFITQSIVRDLIHPKK